MSDLLDSSQISLPTTSRTGEEEALSEFMMHSVEVENG